MSSKSIAKNYIVEDTATVETLGNIELGDKSQYSIISIIGHWKDNLGSFGNSYCYGTLEKKEKITLFLETVCKKESKHGYFVTRGGRKKSLQEAGVGYLEVIEGTNKYKHLIGSNCKYGVSYFVNHIQYTTKCEIKDELIENMKLE